MGLRNEISSAVKWDTPSIEAQDSLRTALIKMAKSGSSALVVKSGDEVIGVVTDMDLMDRIAKGEDLDIITASRFMTSCEIITDKRKKTPCVQLDETQSVENAIGVMATAGVHHLLVTGEKGAGVVSANDLLRLVVD